jgi:hypothetical protein
MISNVNFNTLPDNFKIDDLFEIQKNYIFNIINSNNQFVKRNIILYYNNSFTIYHIINDSFLKLGDFSQSMKDYFTNTNHSEITLNESFYVLFSLLENLPIEPEPEIEPEVEIEPEAEIEPELEPESEPESEPEPEPDIYIVPSIWSAMDSNLRLYNFKPSFNILLNEISLQISERSPFFTDLLSESIKFYVCHGFVHSSNLR